MEEPSERNAYYQTYRLALTRKMHIEVGKLQRKAGLWDRAKLQKMSAAGVIEANAKILKQVGVPDHAIKAIVDEVTKYASTVAPRL